MPSIIAVIIGALWGAFVAKKRGGNLLDVLQYAAAHGLIFGVLTLIGSLIVVQAGWA